MLRQLYRQGFRYMQGIDSRPWLFVDFISFFAVDEATGKVNTPISVCEHASYSSCSVQVTTVREAQYAPMYVAGAVPEGAADTAFVMQKYPLRISRAGRTLLQLYPNGTLEMEWHSKALSLTIQASCLKGPLLQATPAHPANHLPFPDRCAIGAPPQQS